MNAKTVRRSLAERATVGSVDNLEYVGRAGIDAELFPPPRQPRECHLPAGALHHTLPRITGDRKMGSSAVYGSPI